MDNQQASISRLGRRLWCSLARLTQNPRRALDKFLAGRSLRTTKGDIVMTKIRYLTEMGMGVDVHGRLHKAPAAPLPTPCATHR